MTDEAFEVDDVVAVADREVHGLAPEREEIGEIRQRRVPEEPVTAHRVPELEELGAELVPVARAVEESFGHELDGEPVHRCLVQRGPTRELGQPERLVRFAKAVEDPRDLVDDAGFAA